MEVYDGRIIISRAIYLQIWTIKHTGKTLQEVTTWSYLSLQILLTLTVNQEVISSLLTLLTYLFPRPLSYGNNPSKCTEIGYYALDYV